MNLQGEISPELWATISQSYEARHYSNTITDAVHYLSELIREKAGVDGDGSSLIGQAFGGDNPKLQINRLQTQSDKDEQKGFQELLRGVYTGIRNPRSHGQKTDTLKTTDAIILFIDYLIHVINQAKLPFTIEEWTERVFEPFFVQSKEYAVALVAEIPPGKRLDTLITVYQKRNNNKRSVLKLIFQVLAERLEDAQKKEFLKIVSRVLRSSENEEDIITHLEILWPEAWIDLDKVVKMRIEQLVINSVKEGKLVTVLTDKGLRENCSAGTLGVKAAPYFKHFLREEEVISALSVKLQSDSLEEKNYFARYFLNTIVTSNCSEDDIYKYYFPIYLAKAIVEADRAGFFFELVSYGFSEIPEPFRSNTLKRLAELNEPKLVEIFEEAGIPF